MLPMNQITDQAWKDGYIDGYAVAIEDIRQVLLETI